MYTLVIINTQGKNCTIHITFIVVFKATNKHYFSAQETPGEKCPTDLQLKKAKLLCLLGKPNSD